MGIDVYFTLTNKSDPTLNELKKAWEGHARDIEAWQATVNKPVIFNEIGYRSGDGANKLPWDYETPLHVDLQEQVDCYEAAFQTFWYRSWFYGFYWWNWETHPDAGGAHGFLLNGFTPQNKPVEDTIRIWYSLRPHEPAFASLIKESYSSREEVRLMLVVSPSYSTTLRVKYKVSRDGSLVKSDGVKVQIPSSGVHNVSIGRYEAGDYTLNIAIIVPSTNQTLYTASMEFAVEPTLPIEPALPVEPTLPIVPLIIFGITIITIVLVLAIIKSKRRSGDQPPQPQKG